MRANSITPRRVISSAILLRAITGLVLVTAGALGLTGLTVMVYRGTLDLKSVVIDLGLGSTVLVSAAAQLAILIGGWLIWTAFRKGAPSL